MNNEATKNSIPVWLKIFWFLLISLAVFAVIVAHINFNQPLLGKSTFLILFAFIYIIASYLFELRPTKKKHRLAYIFFFGLLVAIFIWILMFVVGVLDWMTDSFGLSDDAALVLSFLISWGLGSVVGDLIGRLRKYKGPVYAPSLDE